MTDIMQSYDEAHDLWENTRKRKLANNTYLERIEAQTATGSEVHYGIRLHSTVVVTFRPDGDVQLDSGGWLTVTTKDRINQALRRYYDDRSWSVWSEKGVWYVGTGNHSAGTDRSWAYADGIILHPNGTVTGEGEDPKVQLKLRRQVKRFARDYIVAWADGKVPAPSAGDCWGCCMKATDGSYPLGSDGSHLLDHMEEKYYVPTLLARAIDRFPVSRAAMHVLSTMWNPEEATARGFDINPNAFGGIATQQLEKSLRRFLYEIVGTGS